jgi:hypothetical protein
MAGNISIKARGAGGACMQFSAGISAQYALPPPVLVTCGLVSVPMSVGAAETPARSRSACQHHVMNLRIVAAALLLAPCTGLAREGDWAATAYGARISTQPGWEDLLIDTAGTEFADSYLLVGALSRQYAQRYDGALALEWEGQAVRHFGDQQHWEFNAVPIVLRWRRFPWSARVATSAAFGLGLSWATEVPRVEVELEGESHRTLVYWMMELTAGPPQADWAVSLRLHHRSVAYGLMGDEGGMNAVGLGVRFQF